MMYGSGEYQSFYVENLEKCTNDRLYPYKVGIINKPHAVNYNKTPLFKMIYLLLEYEDENNPSKKYIFLKESEKNLREGKLKYADLKRLYNYIDEYREEELRYHKQFFINALKKLIAYESGICKEIAHYSNTLVKTSFYPLHDDYLSALSSRIYRTLSDEMYLLYGFCFDELYEKAESYVKERFKNYTIKLPEKGRITMNTIDILRSDYMNCYIYDLVKRYKSGMIKPAVKKGNQPISIKEIFPYDDYTILIKGTTVTYDTLIHTAAHILTSMLRFKYTKDRSDISNARSVICGISEFNYCDNIIKREFFDNPNTINYVYEEAKRYSLIYDKEYYNKYYIKALYDRCFTLEQLTNIGFIKNFLHISNNERYNHAVDYEFGQYGLL